MTMELLRATGSRAQAAGALHSRMTENRIAEAKTAKTSLRFDMLSL